MQPQSSEQIETFVLRFGRFVNGLRRFAPFIPLESPTLAAFEFIENKLNNCHALARYADSNTTRGVNSQNLVATCQEATTASRLLLAALEQRPGINKAIVAALKTALGLDPEESIALPTQTPKEAALTLPPPTNLAVQRYDSGVIVLGWQYNQSEPDIEFEVAVAVGDGIYQRQPREPEVSPAKPEGWPEHSFTSDCSYFHEARALNGKEIAVDTVIWFSVRAIRGKQERSEWTRILSMFCRPTVPLEMSGKGGLSLFGRRAS